MSKTKNSFASLQKNNTNSDIKTIKNVEQLTPEEKPKTDDVTKDVRSIEIILDVIENVKALHQVSFIHINTEYGGKIVDISEKSLIIDDNVKMNWSFFIDIDANSEKELDDLVSKPVIFTVYQTHGEFDIQVFNELQMFEEIAQDPKTIFDSAVSIYEAFTGDIIEDKEYIKSKIKKKEEPVEKPVTKESSITTIREKPKSKKSEKSSFKQKSNDDLLNSARSSQKDGNSLIIGMGTMDMLPLVLGNQTFNASVELKPLISFDDDRMVSYKNIPHMCVTVVIDQPIQFPAKPTILSFTIESIFNIPQIMSSPEMDCRICAWVPFTDNFDRKQILGNSVYKAEDVEYQMKAWPNIPVIGNNVNTTSYRIRRDFDNVRCNGKKGVSALIKKDNPKLVYNYIRRNILTSQNRNVLHNYLLRYRTIVLEVYLADKDTLPPLNSIYDDRKRSLVGNTKAVESKKKTRSLGFLHLMALVDISSLVYPGVTSTRVACQLSTYHEKEIYKATGVQDSYFNPKPKSGETSRQHSDRTLKKVDSEKSLKKKIEVVPNTALPKKGHKTEGVGDEDLKFALPSPPASEVEDDPSMKIFNENGDPTTIIIEIEIAEPLVGARPAEDLMENLRELIPVKPSLPKTALSIKIVEENYRNVVQEISVDLTNHLAKYMMEKKLCHCSNQADFLTFLRRQGVYQKYIITLTKAISVLINKKYDVMDFELRRNNKKHQDLIGRFFVYLVSQMNTVLNNQSCSITGFYRDGPLSSIDATLLYAKEACELKAYTAAEKYFMERLCLEEDNPNVWFDYALFQLELDSPEIAFEYLNESLSRKLDHTNSLLLYGILLTEKGKMSDAETCFMTVLVHRPRWVEGWGILFLFYLKNSNAGGMTFAENMAEQYLNDQRTEQDYIMKSDDLLWATDFLPKTVFFKTAVILLKFRMYYWVEDALSFEIASHPGKVNYLLAAICYFQENYDHALDHLKQAKLIEGWNYAVVALTGHCLMWKHQYEAAMEEFFYVMESYDSPDDMHLLYIQCSKVLSILGKEQQARKIMLKACKNNPTPHTWTVAGTFFYNENDLLSAEECFTEANICNNRIPEVWGFLTLINLKLDRETEAELCYQQARKNELDDTILLAAISDEITNFQKRNYNCHATQFSLSPNLF